MSFQDLERGGGNGKEGSAFVGGGGVSVGIFQLQTAVTGFRRLVDSLGTSKDTPALRNALQDARKRIAQLTQDTSDKLKSYADDAPRNSDEDALAERRRREEEGRLARDFQAVLQDFQKAQRIAAEREATFAPSSSSASRHPPHPTLLFPR